MKTTSFFVWLMALVSLTTYAQLDFGGTPLPSRLGNASNWQLQTNVSDDFNYTFNPTTANADFGPPGQNKWNNFFHNAFEGPGATNWERNHCSVSGGNLNIWASRRFFNNNTSTPYTKSFDFGGQNITRPETLAGCITSKQRIIYPVFVEARVKIMNSSLASDIWLLSPDDKEEIDIIEAYGGAGNDGRNQFFAERIHLSHHVFIRPPNFRDYQPSDFNSWYRQSNVNTWGGRTVRIGVYWKSPTILEYYIDGQVVRILDNDAIASKVVDGRWEYTYPAGVTSTGQDGQLNRGADGFQAMTISGGIAGGFSQSRLDTAKNASNISVIDPFNYLNNGRRFTRQMDIIINVEDQSWQAAANRSPNNTEIQNFNNNNMLVDWIRVYKPNGNGGGNAGGGSAGTTCDTAPDYNGDDNSYSPGDRVVNTSDNNLYERTATGWNLIENCGSSGGGNTGGGSSSEDLALGKDTFQSSTYQNNTNRFGSGRVVDGIGSTFNHTNRQQGAWWEVDLGSIQNIGQVRVWNRGNCCANRLTDFNIVVYNQRGGNVVRTVTVNGSPSANGTDYNVNATGRVVRIQLRGNNFLHMDQVSVFAGSGGGNTGGAVTCSNAPQFNGDSNSYSVGERVINGGILYEKRADGDWNLIENCSGNKDIQSLSVEELEVKIYPNPVVAGDSVTVSGTVEDVVVSDFTGKVVMIIKGNNGKASINTSGLAIGVYFITTNQETQKFIVK